MSSEIGYGDEATIIRSFIMTKRRLATLDDLAPLFEERIVNSMFIMQIISFIEERFQIAVEDDDLIISNFTSVDSIAEFVKRKMKLL